MELEWEICHAFHIMGTQDPIYTTTKSCIQGKWVVWALALELVFLCGEDKIWEYVFLSNFLGFHKNHM